MPKIGACSLELRREIFADKTVIDESCMRSDGIPVDDEDVALLRGERAIDWRGPIIA